MDPPSPEFNVGEGKGSGAKRSNIEFGGRGVCVGGSGTEFKRNQIYVRNMVISVALKKPGPILGASSGVNGTLDPGASACPQRATVCVCVCNLRPPHAVGAFFLHIGGIHEHHTPSAHLLPQVLSASVSFPSCVQFVWKVSLTYARASGARGGGATGDHG